MAKLFVVGKDQFPEGMIEYLGPRLAELGVHIVELKNDNGDIDAYFCDERLPAEFIKEEAYYHADKSEELASGRIVEVH